MGFILTTGGIQPDSEKIKNINESPFPKNVKELTGFLGLINFYSKFSDKHAAETLPLLKLLKRGTV